MSTLHIVNKSPFADGALLSCIRHAKPGDSILLIEDGVYGALAGSAPAEAVQARPDAVALYLLDGDAAARGLPPAKWLSEVAAVGYDGFVDLVTAHTRTQSWL